ncbi:MAG: YbaN family protein [Chlorobi bacterium]|nr:YbaN family protein [Chlorobiota bacterium]MCI0716023.1 YbaN family protein [Chlorobiota bacterium]
MTKGVLNNYKTEEIRENQNPVVRWILIISGFVLIGIGILGMFLPLLPTTVFFILAAWCFARSSGKFYYWLHHNRLFGKYLRDYSSGGGMSVKSKIYSILFLWTGILVSAILLTENLYVRILLLAIAVGVTWHIASLKTIKETEN